MKPIVQPENLDLRTTGALPSAVMVKEELRSMSEHRLALNLIEKYYPMISDSDFQSCQRNILRHLDTLKASCPDLRALRGKNILDLACGSRNYEDTSKAYEPWMPRLLYELGANVVGIDLAPQKDEKFKSYCVDLTIIDALAFLPRASFDACHIDGFPTREALKSIDSQGIAWEQLKANLKDHCQRVLRPHGIVLNWFTQFTDDFVMMSLPKGLRDVPDEEL